jgi:hypothetical protein
MKSFVSIYHFKSYIRYYLQAESNNYIHSDFVFKWYQAIHQNNELIMDSFAKELVGFFSTTSIKYIIRTRHYLNVLDWFILNDGNFIDFFDNKNQESLWTSKLHFLVITSSVVSKLNGKSIPFIQSYLSESSTLIMSGIRDSKLSFENWNLLQANEGFNMTIDFGDLGFLFRINNRSPKQHFILR